MIKFVEGQDASAPSDASKEPPPGWGADELTSFIDFARTNQWATFWNKRESAGRLIAIDAQFVTVSRGWQNPESEIAAFLLLRCHAAFRSAAALALAGQVAETFSLCRLMLEFAAYAVHIYRDPPLAMIWLNRHNDAAAIEAQRTAFSHRKVQKSVSAANRDAGKRFEDLYQRTIDYGGHPNERSVTGNMKMLKEPGSRTMLAVMLQGDGAALDHALKTVAQCGVVSLEMLQVVFNARFELLGVNAAMFDLKKGL